MWRLSPLLLILCIASFLAHAQESNLKPITFWPDSYNADVVGLKSISELNNYLSNINSDKIKSLIFIGHSNCSPKLNIASFDVNNGEPVKLPNGKVTNRSEAEMADLSLILSIGRMKAVWKALQNNSTMKACIDQKKFWLFPAGSLYGNELRTSNNLEENKSKISIVQIIVITNNDEEINSNPELPYGTEFNSPILSASRCKLFKNSSKKYSRFNLHAISRRFALRASHPRAGNPDQWHPTERQVMMNKTKNVMVVDDDSVVHFLSEKALSAFSWINKQYSAFNGKEAIQLLENYCRGLITLPDLILLDLHMPVMDGFQFIEAFQKMDCLKDSVVVIAVLSSTENPIEKERLHSLGIKHVIPKPISAEKLSQLLNKEFRQICL